MSKRNGVRASAVRVVVAGAVHVVLVFLLGSVALAAAQYEIDVNVDWDGGTFAGTAHVTAENNTLRSIDELVFRLFPNDDVIYGGASLRVAEVSVAGEAVEIGVQSDATVLPILLPVSLPPGQTVGVTLNFHGTAGPSTLDAPAGTAGYGILTKNPRSLVLTAFYPILAVLDDGGWQTDPTCGFGDALWSEAADYSVTVTTTETLAPAASGRLLSSQTEDGLSVHRFAAESARDFSLVLMRGYEESELQSGSQTLRAWFTPSERTAAQRTLELASRALELFARRIGPLPFDEIEFVEVPLHRAAGVEFSGVILVASSYALRPFDPFYDIIVSHEMAHQWFYAVVGNNPSASPWLDEGLATYLSNVFLEETSSEEAREVEVRTWQDKYRSARSLYPDLAVGDAACSFPTASIYSSYVYDGGAWFLHAVRNEIGDDAFFAALSAYYDIGGIGTEDSLFEAFEDACDCDLAALFESFGFGVE